MCGYLTAGNILPKRIADRIPDDSESVCVLIRRRIFYNSHNLV